MTRSEDRSRDEWTEEQTGAGGATGTPSLNPDLEPPSLDQEENDVVSGGGVVDHEDQHGDPPAEQNTDVE